MANLNFVVGCPGLLETLEEVHFVSKRRELDMALHEGRLFFRRKREIITKDLVTIVENLGELCN